MSESRYSTEKYATTSEQWTHQRDLRNDVTFYTGFYMSSYFSSTTENDVSFDDVLFFAKEF